MHVMYEYVSGKVVALFISNEENVLQKRRFTIPTEFMRNNFDLSW